jgi:hypothetical protein
VQPPRILILIALAAAAFAQTTPEPAQPRARLDEIQQRLNLTPEQTEQIRPILADEMKQLRALREKSQAEQNRRARLQLARQARSIREEADEKLKKILTKPQMDELAKIRDERRDDLRERRKSAR